MCIANSKRNNYHTIMLTCNKQNIPAASESRWLYIYIYIYIYMCVCVYIYIYIYIYIYSFFPGPLRRSCGSTETPCTPIKQDKGVFLYTPIGVCDDNDGSEGMTMQ